MPTLTELKPPSKYVNELDIFATTDKSASYPRVGLSTSASTSNITGKVASAKSNSAPIPLIVNPQSNVSFTMPLNLVGVIEVVKIPCKFDTGTKLPTVQLTVSMLEPVLYVNEQVYSNVP